MADTPESKPSSIGSAAPQMQGGLIGAEIAAGIATLVWLAISGVLVLRGEFDVAGRTQAAAVAVLIVVPIGLAWVLAAAARTRRQVRSEITELRRGVEALRKAYVTQAQQDNSGTAQLIARRLDELVAGQRKAETSLAMLGSIRMAEMEAAAPTPKAVAQAPVDTTQPTLALGTPAEALEPPLSNEDFIRALNFPETAEDQEGFSALRRALKHRSSEQLIRASQDILTLLSQEGIYMDDLRPDLARPEIWRKFAKGERGRAVAPLGGIRDRSSLALTAGRMKTDPVFRDAAHHFLRKFDQTFSPFEEGASDSDLSGFANTRTARAFMLIGRVAGTFD
ncbi:hypothetical protein [Pseudoprimorskyibacter insulae]|uniref:Uncharacterized protein n=1 Tax=Pseudoprimorskyibacter insulae TaxID=1695997 RepID=A0A2R8ANY9_9RHOB|nr:hypothetical protein [Pseudoprimorskyibacter insulae]SPF77579.1 hypothetical protein PRI8871_00162 [Pseudoprimorskyibacter insulae]